MAVAKLRQRKQTFNDDERESEFVGYLGFSDFALTTERENGWGLIAK